MKDNNTLWMNKETGELLAYMEMLEQAREWYDLDDDTNVCNLSEYYEDTGDPVPADWFDDDYIEGEIYDDEMGFDPYEGCYTWDC